MELAVVLHAHENAKLVLDTAQSINRWASENIVVLADGKSPGWLMEEEFPLPYVIGFRNQTKAVFRNHSSYRNHTLGLLKILEHHPDCDWYCSTEYDTLFCSDKFKEDLNSLPSNVWLAGFNGRRTFMNLPLLESIVGGKCYSQNYFIGCCMFFRGEFLRRIRDAGLFEKILEYTNGFDHGYFPNYWEQGGYDFTECLFPTLVNIAGGEAVSFSGWNKDSNAWSGDYKKYPIRWPDPISLEESVEASILHPTKSYEDPVRCYHRERRDH